MKRTYELRKGETVLETMTAEWIEIQTRVQSLNHRYGGGVVAKKVGIVPPDEENVLYVDAWTSGNPGLGGYRICTVVEGKVVELVRKDSELVHTNNFYELYAILEGIIYAAANSKYVVYSDSATALAWIKNGKAKCSQDIESVGKLIIKINALITKYPLIRLVKWDTSVKGEIPADFNRK